MRTHNRKNHELRPIQLTKQYTKHAEGSVLVEFGATKVLCTASVQDGAPRFIKEKGHGWLTAEYGMLPRATHDRCDREAAKGKQSGRTQEIQRLIGRSLRAAVDLTQLGEFTIVIDCDVIQADGGTRTASITGACVALYDAIEYLKKHKGLKKSPFKQFIAAISAGVVNGEPVLDLDYSEDSTAHTDMNIVMNEQGHFIEVQGTAENQAFEQHELNSMLELAKAGIAELIVKQKACLQIK